MRGWHLVLAISVPLSCAGPVSADPLDDAKALNNKVLELNQQGKYAEAIPIAERVLAIDEKVLGPDHPGVAAHLDSLALLYTYEGRYADAEPLYKRALAIVEKALGPGNTHVATALNNLAALYNDEGRYGDAEPLYKRALTIDGKVLGPDHVHVAAELNNLADLYREEGRNADAEPLYKRAIAINEKALGPNHPDGVAPLNNLAILYDGEGRHSEAEPLFKRVLTINEKVFGPSHPEVAMALNNLAGLYREEGRSNDAEPLYKRTLAIGEKSLGPNHRHVATALNNLAGLYEDEGRHADAEPLFEQAVTIDEKALGPDHPDVAASLNNLAWSALAQKDWAKAANGWRRATAIVERRATRGVALSSALTGKAESDAQRYDWFFKGLVVATDQFAPEGGAEHLASGNAMFEKAQWAQSSEAAASLAQMALRGGAGKPDLAAIVRERQDLLGEWQQDDKALIASKALAPDKRDSLSEEALANRLAAIDGQVKDIDARLAREYSDYAALASPKPLDVGAVQALLHQDEALVLFLDTDARFNPLPEATFVWVVTKTESRWVRSDLGAKALQDRVATLRCGVDRSREWHWSKETHRWSARKQACAALKPDGLGANEPLPFDLAAAHDLYRRLFAKVDDLIADKQLLIVPSGPLTQLPFQVLVTSLTNAEAYGERTREVGRLGAQLQDLSPDERQSNNLSARAGVKIVHVLPNEAADKAGLKSGDILLSIDGTPAATFPKAIEAIKSHGKGAKIEFQILRAGIKLTIPATLGGTTVTDWVPRLLAPGEEKDVHWLIAEHALTVLPSVSSLRALRQYAKTSAAGRALVAFANPLLDGPDARYAELAKEARAKQSCPKSAWQQVAQLFWTDRDAEAPDLRGGLANVDKIRRAPPLPETADEVCAVAQDLHARDSDIHLGADATETRVKNLSTSGELARYKIVQFATHGAIAGEAKLSSEPGLILTPPVIASETDDGYLSASEIAALKLDADWVILSACNTAAGDAKDAQPLSGLAKAFFYAGARALLVSHWSVNSQAAVKLITGTMSRIADDPRISRAEGLRQSMLALIASKDATEAQPSYWAPFVIVGEGAPTVQAAASSK